MTTQPIAHLLDRTFWARATPLFIPGYASPELCSQVNTSWPHLEHGGSRYQVSGLSWSGPGGTLGTRNDANLPRFLPTRPETPPDFWINRYDDHEISFHSDGLVGRLVTGVCVLAGAGQLSFEPRQDDEPVLTYRLSVGDALFWHMAIDEKWEHGGPSGQRTSLIMRWNAP